MVENEIVIPEELRNQIADKAELIEIFQQRAAALDHWDKDNLMTMAKSLAQEQGIKLGDLAAVLRILLTGANASPSVFEIMAILGKEISFQRLHRQ